MAGIFKRVLGYFGLANDHNDNQDSTAKETPSTGFTVKVAVPKTVGPVVSECFPGSGGVQGLQWYVEKLRIDEDGDIAQEFFGETISQEFEVNMRTMPIKFRGSLQTHNGNIDVGGLWHMPSRY